MVASRLLGGDFAGGEMTVIRSRGLRGRERSRRNTEKLRFLKGLFTWRWGTPGR